MPLCRQKSVISFCHEVEPYENLKFILVSYDLGNTSPQMAPTEFLLYSLNFYPLVCIDLVCHIICKISGKISDEKVKERGGPEILSRLCPYFVAISLFKHSRQIHLCPTLKVILKEILNFSLWETQLSEH